MTRVQDSCQYSLDTGRVLALANYPRYLAIVRDREGDMAGLVMEHVVRSGQDTGKYMQLYLYYNIYFLGFSPVQQKIFLLFQKIIP